MFSFTELRSHTSASYETNTPQYKGQMQIILALDGYKKKDRKLMLTNRLIVYLSWRIMKCLYTTGISNQATSFKSYDSFLKLFDSYHSSHHQVTIRYEISCICQLSEK